MTHSSARRLGAASWIAGLVALAGCATPDGPPASLAAAQAQIDAARSEGGSDAGESALASAQAKLARARQLAPMDPLRAHRLAEEAGSDAALVRAQASNQRSQRALAEVRRSLLTLGEELQRGVARPPSPAASR